MTIERLEIKRGVPRFNFSSTHFLRRVLIPHMHESAEHGERPGVILLPESSKDRQFLVRHAHIHFVQLRELPGLQRLQFRGGRRRQDVIQRGYSVLASKIRQPDSISSIPFFAINIIRDLSILSHEELCE